MVNRDLLPTSILKLYLQCLFFSFYDDGFAVVDSLLIVAPFVGFCVCFLFVVHCILSFLFFYNILVGK